MNDNYGPRFYSEIGRRGGETARNERGTPRTKDRKAVKVGKNDKIS